jgi:hypothetical protein
MFRRAFAQSAQSLPAMLRHNWRNVLMPWRMLPYPIALALIGLVALAMVCTEPIAEPVADPVPTLEASTVGGTVVPDGLDCAEDEVIGFVGIPDTLVCVHPDFLEAQRVAKLPPCLPPEVFNTSAWQCVTPPIQEACVPPAVYSEELTHCVNPDGTLPCASGHNEIGGVCVPLGYGTPDADGLAHPLGGGGESGTADDDDGCSPPNTWAGSAATGYRCIPLVQLEQEGGRTGEIVVTPTGGRQGGTVSYHTVPCAANETSLPPPYADVVLCVNTAEWEAVH